MKKSLTVLLSATVTALAIMASSTAAYAGTQQEKMKTCNDDAATKELKGDERKAFMSNCLKADAVLTQQEKMKACNADTQAKTLKGDERKAFMKSCLSN